MSEPDSGRRFRRIAAAGIFFQGGAAAIDTGTIVAALVHVLTGSAIAVGAAAAIARYGWLFPQLFVAYHARNRRRRMPYYKVGAFGRVACLIAVCALLVTVPADSPRTVVIGFFVLWTVYAFVGGIVAVPYNDIVARAIPSPLRSRLLATRFFGGGVLALMVAGAAHRALGALVFPLDYALVLLLGAALLLISALCFISAGEPEATPPRERHDGFADFLRGGLRILRENRRFRLFIQARWLDGAVTMAFPFYIVQATAAGAPSSAVALLLGAQTAGALLSNPLWGWLGDRRGKRQLLEAVVVLAALPSLLTLGWIAFGHSGPGAAPVWFAMVFAVLGAAGNGGIIAQLGYLMEISPDDDRPAYSGYFNALVAPAALLPLAGGLLMKVAGPAAVFGISAGAAMAQWLVVRRLQSAAPGDST
ncbi:MAG: MFS transporter [SAR324 cluster bacterium]|nr:MFS transporter [SAR324 cluster bacterium]